MSSNRHYSPDLVRKAAERRQVALDESSRSLAETHRLLLEIGRKLDAIIEHLQVPYKPPAGFIKE